jgi:dihydroorotase
MGMPLQAVVRSNTSRAAEVIKRPDLGHLGVGAEADVAVLNVRRGTFGFVDSGGGKLPGDRKLECELTIKGGQVVWDLNGISRAAWTEPR